LETNAVLILNSIIAEEETRTGQKSNIPRATTEKEAMQNEQVMDLMIERINKIIEISGWFLDAIMKTVNQLPYGLRWILKQISEIANKNFKVIFQKEGKNKRFNFKIVFNSFFLLLLFHQNKIN
jgi:hypothetical protein